MKRTAIKTINAHCNIVYEWEDGKIDPVYYIYSYDTLVLTVTDTGYGYILHRDWKGYSATTIKDINKCLEHLGSSIKVNKKLWESMADVDKAFSDITKRN